MENIYDTAHKLASKIRASKEFNDYKIARKKVLASEALKEKITSFEKLRYDVQVLSLEKGEKSPEKMQKLQEMYNILVADKEIKEYFDLEVKFNVMVADINKIIAESMEDILKK